jgi:DNA-binding CsgD family transcriptional regulator
MDMKNLSQTDFRAILDFLNVINRLQTVEDFYSTMLTRLQTIVEGDWSFCFEFCPAEENRLIRTSHPKFEAIYAGWRRVCHQHPGWEHHICGGEGRWLRLSDYLSEIELHHTTMYQEIWRESRVEDNLGTLSMISPMTMAGVTINRDRRSFKERDLLALNLLRPHLMQAWRNNSLAGHLSEGIRTEQVPESCEMGVVVLDGRQRIRFITATAHQRIEKYFGRLSAGDCLPEKLHSWVCYRTSLLEQSPTTGPADPLVLQGAGNAELTVTLLLDPARVTLILQERVPLGDLTALGLTRRESDVLLWVTRGKSNEEIGIILTMSRGTVKKHLERIFKKLGVENRTSAAATIRLRAPLC